MLIEMLKESESFKNMNVQKQELTAILAYHFENNPKTLYMTPEELIKHTQKGNKEQWIEFLGLEPVRNYIRAEMSYKAQVAQRKAFQSLANSAEDGNVQAAKEINELSGIMQSADNNKIIVLHRISRPEIKK